MNESEWTKVKLNEKKVKIQKLMNKSENWWTNLKVNEQKWKWMNKTNGDGSIVKVN